jgi:hypothetical protein
MAPQKPGLGGVLMLAVPPARFPVLLLYFSVKEARPWRAESIPEALTQT